MPDARRPAIRTRARRCSRRSAASATRSTAKGRRSAPTSPQRPQLVRAAALERLRPQPGDRRRLPGDARSSPTTAASSPACWPRTARSASCSSCRAASWRRSPRDEIDEIEVSKLSLMPEGPREAAQAAGDRRPVRVPHPRQAAERSAGAAIARRARRRPRETTDPARIQRGGWRGGPWIYDQRFRRRGRRHPGRTFWPPRRAAHTPDRPAASLACCETTIEVPAGKQSSCSLDVSHDPRWRLEADRQGERQVKLHDVDRRTEDRPTTVGSEVVIDLSPLAGQKVDLELLNQANGWAWEFGYWGRVEVVTQ